MSAARRGSTALWIALVALGLAWGYHGLLSSYFLRDDFMWLFDSERQLARPIEFLTTRPSGYFRPFANLFFGLEHLTFGLDPRGYYVVNILLHGWNALWLGALVLAFGGSRRLAGAAALVAATLGAAAPGVVWISGLVSLLAIAMVLPALFFYHAFLRDGRRLDFALALLCIVLAVCARESGVLAGLGFLVLELGHVRGRALALLRQPNFWRRMAPFVVVGALYVWLQLDFVSGGAGTRNELGSPLAYLGNVITSLPALLRPDRWRLGFSLSGGLALLAGAALLLGLLRGRRGLFLFAALFGLLLFAFLPTYPLLSGDVVMANRYRYEATFVAALFVAALFDAGFSARGGLVGRGLASLGLVVFVGFQLEALPRFVDQDERFGAYAQSTRLLAEQLETNFGAALRASAAAASTTEGMTVVALVGAPVENPRHLRCQLGVWYDLPFERVTEVDFSLVDGTTVASLRRSGAAYVKQVTGADEVWVWSEAKGLVRGKPPLSAMRKNWRRPGKPSEVSKVQLLHLATTSPAPAPTSPEVGP